MKRPIRVLVVDDSTVIRRMLTDTLSQDSAIEVAGTAANGKIALAKIPQTNPDVISLDLEMPVMDGLQTLLELQRLYPKIPVIIFSTLSTRGAEATLDALARGASDYVAKPVAGSPEEAVQSIRDSLLPKIKAFCPWFSDPKQSTRVTQAPKPRRTANRSNAIRIDMLAIGVSTGGPNALAEVLPKLPADFPIPIVIVQHMPPIFTKQLAERLNQMSQISVVEAKAGDELHGGCAWLAPGGQHMRLKRKGIATVVELTDDPPENFCRPAVDVLLRSVNDMYGQSALVAILTGMGRDGVSGCRAIYGSGGHIIAQDEATSVVWGMPGAVVQENLADRVLPLQKIHSEITNQAFQGRRSNACVAGGSTT